MADVFAKHREVEAGTAKKNSIGRQNLVETLAHVGVLFQRADQLDRDAQLEQVAFIEDHLRRVMMESFEGEVYAVIGKTWDDKSRRSVGRLYDRRVAPLIRIGRLHGHITPDEVRRRFDQISDNVVAARGAKVAADGWNAWKDASDDLKTAAGDITELRKEMAAAVDAAAATWRWVLGIGLAIVLAIASHFAWPRDKEIVRVPVRVSPAPSSRHSTVAPKRGDAKTLAQSKSAGRDGSGR
jgi:hypothetical protein